MRRALLKLCLLLVLSFGLQAVEQGPPIPQGILALGGSPAPALRLTDIDGREFNLGDQRGHWVFVHFLASWCAPCRREMPSIQRMAAALRERGPEVVLVNTAEDEDTIFEFLAAVALEFASLTDRDGLVTEGWQPRGLPASYLVDPGGRLRFQALGGLPWDEAPYIDFLKRISIRDE